MSLEETQRKVIHEYCTRDLPGDLAWHVDQFSFVGDVQLRRCLGRAFYSARYVAKLMEALLAKGDEIHAFVKFQIAQYASIYEALISYLLWTRYVNHSELKKLQTHKAYKPVAALAGSTTMKYENEELFTCVHREARTPKSSIPFKEKVDCAVRIGFVDGAYADDIKRTYELRNLMHIETEAEKQIEIDLEQARTGYRRLKPFLERIQAAIAKEGV